MARCGGIYRARNGGYFVRVARFRFMAEWYAPDLRAALHRAAEHLTSGEPAIERITDEEIDQIIRGSIRSLDPAKPRAVLGESAHIGEIANGYLVRTTYGHEAYAPNLRAALRQAADELALGDRSTAAVTDEQLEQIVRGGRPRKGRRPAR